MKQSAARRTRRTESIVGNLPSSLPGGSQFPVANLGFCQLSSPTAIDEGFSQLDCREFVNPVDRAIGSNQGLRNLSPPCYGPLRTPKVFGGAVLSSQEVTAEAPCSSTSEQIPRNPASNGTSRSHSLARAFMDILAKDEDLQISEAQSQLFELTQQDLMNSCTQFFYQSNNDTGQQLLSDLQRLEHLAHRQLGLQGDLPHIRGNTGLIAQNLTSISSNSSNLCFSNAAFRCWAWVSSFVADPSMMWGRLHQAFRTFLGSSQSTSLTEIPEMHDIWTHFDHAVQADVGDFVGHMWSIAKPIAIGSKFFHVRSNGILEEREQVPLNILFPPGANKIDLQTLLNSWADEAKGQYLYGQPDCLVLHLQRFELVQQQWAKHHRELHIPTEVFLPYSNDGIAVAKAYYRVLAMVLHQGETHDSGHFMAIHAVDNAYWLVNDNIFPKPISNLSEQHGKEVIQLWLILDPNDEMQVDFVAEESPPPKKQKTHYDEINLCFANVTTFGKKVQDWVWSKADHLLFLQETHLNLNKSNEALQYFIVRGWKGIAVPAAKTDKGGTTGGFLCLHPPHHHVHDLQHFDLEGNGWMAVGLQREDMHIAIIQLYLKTGESLQSATNAEILANLFGFLDNLKAPFISGGDWQNPPSELAATVIQSKFKAHIRASEGPTTLEGSQLDFLLISNELAGAISFENVWDVPWRPHCALNVKFTCQNQAIPVQQLRTFPPIGRALSAEIPWTDFPEQNGPFHILNYQITGLGTDLARWCTQSELYLTQQLQHPRLGRGSRVDLFTAPLQGPHQIQLWKKGRPAFWEKMAVRINVLHHAPHEGVKKDLLTMLNSVQEYSSEDLNQDEFLDLIKTLEKPQNDPQHLQNLVLSQEHQAHVGVALANTEEYKLWLQNAHSKGLRDLFRSLRQKDIPWQRPFQDLPIWERLQARLEQWGSIWQPVDEPCVIRGFRELREDAIAQARDTQAINPISLQRVIKKLPNKASGPDGISYDFLKQLPFEAVTQLAKLLNTMEQEALLPTQLRMVSIVMIPKNPKVERPIALTSCLYRLWNRVRKQDIVKWQLSLDSIMPWDHARPKKDCLSIAVGRMLQSELCKHNNIHTVTCLADLSCFYDTVTLDNLIAPARELEYPLLHLKLAIDLYRGPRIIQAEGITSDPQHYQ